MKNYNIILGLAATIVAATASMTSLALIPPHFINIRYCNQTNFVCSTVNVCTTMGNVDCKVMIQGFTATVYDVKINPTQCSVPVKYNGGPVFVEKPGEICEVR